MLNRYISLNFVMFLLVLAICCRFFFVLFDAGNFFNFHFYLRDFFKVEAFGSVEGSKEKKSDEPVDLLDRDSFYMYDTAGLGRIEVEVFNELQKNKNDNEKVIEYINNQKELIKQTTTYVEQKISELQIVRDDIQGLIKSYYNAKDDKVKSLVKIYENMKPAEAAAILSELDDDLLLKVVRHMKETKSSPILAQMKPARVRDITVGLVQEDYLREIDLRHFCSLIQQ
ncbi:hypothetical protein GUI12_03880 [Anaplasmataceae bacterium AB001_6]|nr:hypothetical protein GUI12_03880 [Anaplasmataceae bacterium AB001_6]